jgi:hypothetical protein
MASLFNNSKKYSLAFLDYLWVLTIYVIFAFTLSNIMDNYILKPFDEKKAKAQTSLRLGSEIILQLAVQGFFVIMITEIMINIYSPFDHNSYYDSRSGLGILIRNPTIIAVILYNSSSQLQGRLKIFLSRFGVKTEERVDFYV